VLTDLAARFDAAPLFPFEGPPYWPFQAWAKRAAPVFPSPLGLLIHPDYGLSHSYRGALAFAQALDFPPPPPRDNPCTACSDRPCLAACPVGAFSPAGYAVEVCAQGLRMQVGAACLEAGCRAREACPVGREQAQSREQARFHMAAFLAARRATCSARRPEAPPSR
jgi:epoxyqueuosine reductase QueG